MSRRPSPRCCLCGELAVSVRGVHTLCVHGSDGERVAYSWHDAGCLDTDPLAQRLADVASMPDGPESDAAMGALYMEARTTLIERHGEPALPAVLRVLRDFPEAWRTLRARGRWGLVTEVRRRGTLNEREVE